MQPKEQINRRTQDNAPAPGQFLGLALRFGVGSGLLCATWLLFLLWSGNNPFGPKQIMGLLVVPFVAAGSQWYLRRQMAPRPPGVGRTLAVGGLTVMLAALLAAASVWGLAQVVSEQTLEKNRQELLEITRVQQRMRPKEKRNPAFEKQELAQAATVSASAMARGTFTYTVLLGLLLALPSGIFLRK